MSQKKILVAMSGGVDSSVTAGLLKEAGHDVGGATIRTWSPNDCVTRNTKACCGLTGVEDARQVAESLDIPYWVFNFEDAFKTHVVNYFAGEYFQGRTPNPCIACNEHVKFRLFLTRARQLGFDYIATGHYAQILWDSRHQQYFLSEGADPAKDQSYVLFPLSQELLPYVVMPLGQFTKAEIRAKAREMGLCVQDKPDSQEICFVPSNDYGAFLEREFVEKEEHVTTEMAEKSGKVRRTDGTVIGSHKGYYHYTRGQRRGLGIPHTERLYVVETNRENNEVVLGKREEILNRFCTVGRINWFLKPAGGEPVLIHCKIRSQHKKSAAFMQLVDDHKVCIEFQEPQEAITPGQAAVFYDGAKVLGGGWIESFS